MMTLPQTTDCLRNEAVVILDAARRTAEAMSAAMEAVREGHAKIKMLEAENERLRKALNEIGNDTNLTGSGRGLVAREALQDNALAKKSKRLRGG